MSGSIDFRMAWESYCGGLVVLIADCISRINNNLKELLVALSSPKSICQYLVADSQADSFIDTSEGDHRNVEERFLYRYSTLILLKRPLKRKMNSSMVFVVALLTAASPASSFFSPCGTGLVTTLFASDAKYCGESDLGTRRSFMDIAGTTFFVNVIMPSRASADGKSFAPGGTLVDYEVGVAVGNSGASKSRRADNSNVIFSQDYYYKFGTAPQWIEDGNTDFPKTMPFTLSQQRYDTMKKYRERVQRGVDKVASLRGEIENGDYYNILDGSAPEYYIRPMGLMANGFLASENTGTTNELLLARWYINEIALDIDDIKNAKSKEEAKRAYEGAVKAVNSFLSMLNRVITPKVGEKMKLL
eukprot:scaffold1184_cov132-Cylindrotheca_fusiformis.AAC.55